MADWNRIGRALGGFAAGYAGDGPQYVAALQRADQLKMIEEERKRKESQERQQSTEQRTANQIRMARQRMEQNPVAALPLINEMMMGIPGADRGTLGQIKQSILASQTTGVVAPGQKQQILGQAAQQLRALEDSFINRGLLQPEQPKEEEEYTLAPGAQRFRGGRMIAENPEEEQRKTAQDRNGILRYLDTGEPVFPNVTETITELRGKEYNDIASGLRAEIAKENTEFQKIANSWDRITASAEDPSAAGDLALIFNFMKMLDPGSTVREGEFANAQNATGVPNRVRAWWNNLQNGERLTPEQRADFFGQAQNIFESTNQRAMNIVDQYSEIGQRLGVRREDIFVDRGAPPSIGNEENQEPDDPKKPSRLRYNPETGQLEEVR